jgi:hypothetical protein
MVSKDILYTEPTDGVEIFPDKYVTLNAQYVNEFTMESTA